MAGCAGAHVRVDDRRRLAVRELPLTDLRRHVRQRRRQHGIQSRREEIPPGALQQRPHPQRRLYAVVSDPVTLQRAVAP